MSAASSDDAAIADRELLLSLVANLSGPLTTGGVKAAGESAEALCDIARRRAACVSPCISLSYSKSCASCRGPAQCEAIRNAGAVKPLCNLLSSGERPQEKNLLAPRWFSVPAIIARSGPSQFSTVQVRKPWPAVPPALCASWLRAASLFGTRHGTRALSRRLRCAAARPRVVVSATAAGSHDRAPAMRPGAHPRRPLLRTRHARGCGHAAAGRGQPG